MAKPIFLLGVGCQRGGTSWLFTYLARRPGVALSALKEMHVFDNLFLPELASPGASPLIAEMVRNPALYREFFLQLSRKARIVGEITPAYSVLSTEHFAEIRTLMSADFDMRVIFLMRDPVERVWSSAKMEQRVHFPEQTTEQVFTTKLDDAAVAARTRYDLTIEALALAFEPAELFLGFYERLFSDLTLTELCRFLTVDFAPGKYAASVNSDPRRTGIPPHLIPLARQTYAPVYDYCTARFGPDFIKSIWPHA